MSNEDRDLSIFIYTEDSGADAHTIMQCLCAGAFNQINSSWRSGVHPRFLPEDGNERRASHFNRWKARGDKEARDFARLIATRLLRRDIVVVHFDGDRPFSQSQGGTSCENLSAFEGKVCGPLKQMLALKKAPEELLQNLILLIPFHNRESWIFINFAEARRILQDQGRAEMIAALQPFEADPRLLDETPDLKARFEPLAKQSLELVQKAWPSRRAHAAQASFMEAVERIRRENGAVVTRLSAPSSAP